MDENCMFHNLLQAFVFGTLDEHGLKLAVHSLQLLRTALMGTVVHLMEFTTINNHALANVWLSITTTA